MPAPDRRFTLRATPVVARLLVVSVLTTAGVAVAELAGHAPAVARLSPPASSESEEPAAAAVSAHAEQHYRTAYRTSAPAIRVTRVEVELESPVAVRGESNRYRFSGKAHLVLFDQRSFSYSRATSTFEAIVVRQGDESIEIADFTVKS